MSIPTKVERYTSLMEHLRLAQEDAAMLMHLNSTEGDGPGMVIGKGWFHVSEGLKRMQELVMHIATGKATLQ